MNYRLLFILIPGDDDERFFRRKLKPLFEDRYDSVILWKHSQKANQQIHNLLKSIEAMKADYIYVEDINLAPCVTAKKQKMCNALKTLRGSRISLAVREIESWYLAGLNKESLKILGIKKHFSNTNSVTKEILNQIKPSRFDSRIDFMSEILNHFSMENARRANNSFRYFLEKYELKD